MKLPFAIEALVVLLMTSSTCLAVGADAEWNTRMRAMAAAVTCLAPFVASDEKFNDLKNHLQINSCVDDLAIQTQALKAALTKHATAGSAAAFYQEDPLLPFVAASFAEDVETAKALVNSTSSAYAQHLLRGTLTYCTGCHTRGADTATFKFPVFQDMTKDLALPDRMKLLASTRNFEQSLRVFDEAINSGQAELMGSLEVERSARLALSIAVRVENDGGAGLKLIDQIAKLKNISPAFKIEIETWRTSLTELAKSEPNVLTANTKQTSKLEAAQKLIAKAKATRSQTQTRIPEIDYLRATALLHSFLGTKPSAKDSAEALFLLGDSYENLETLGFWSTSEIYYEACVRKFPHSEVARRCYASYKDSISIGYSGSAGTFIPMNVQTNLRELETLGKALKK